MRRLSVLGAAVLLVVVLGVAQLVLPGIAAHRLRDRLSRSGTVLEVEVDAVPAIELLWHHADRVIIRMGDYRSNPARLSQTLAQVGDAGSLDASARRLTSGLLTLRDASLRKRANRLTGTATVTQADLRSSFPVLDSVQPVPSSGGTLTLRGTATAFGVSATVDASVAPLNGALVLSPDVPLGGLVTITLFSSPEIAVESVSAAPAQEGFTLVARARLK